MQFNTVHKEVVDFWTTRGVISLSRIKGFKSLDTGLVLISHRPSVSLQCGPGPSGVGGRWRRGSVRIWTWKVKFWKFTICLIERLVLTTRFERDYEVVIGSCHWFVFVNWKYLRETDLIFSLFSGMLNAIGLFICQLCVIGVPTWWQRSFYYISSKTQYVVNFFVSQSSTTSIFVKSTFSFSSLYTPLYWVILWEYR